MVLVRLTRTAPGDVWDGALYYATPSHKEAIGYFGKPTSGAKPAVGETTTLVYDMSRQANGGPDWMQSTIDQIRLDVEDKPERSVRDPPGGHCAGSCARSAPAGRARASCADEGFEALTARRPGT